VYCFADKSSVIITARRYDVPAGLWFMHLHFSIVKSKSVNTSVEFIGCTVAFGCTQALSLQPGLCTKRRMTSPVLKIKRTDPFSSTKPTTSFRHGRANYVEQMSRPCYNFCSQTVTFHNICPRAAEVSSKSFINAVNVE
jgi:hypothetical protein